MLGWPAKAEQMKGTRLIAAYALLALTLLLGQIAAQAHAYSHLRSGGNPVPPAGQHAPCTECLSFAPLLSATHSSHGAVEFQFEDVSAKIDAQSVSLTSRSTSHGYLSRAPPALLY